MQALDALGNPIRRDILRKLHATPLSVRDLAAKFPVSRPAVSRHLRMLQQAGLVEGHRQGTQMLYQVRVQGFASVRDFIDEFWNSALARLEELSRK